MNNIKDITIRNYRGIRYAEVSGMARVNVFLGNNNCGKSSVLESVLMLLGANSPALPLAVNVNRNYSTVDKNDFTLFFHNCDVANVINIEACLADNTYMRLDMAYSESAIEEIPVSDMQNGIIETLKRYTLNQKYTYGAKEYRTALVYNAKDSKLSFVPAEENAKCPSAFYMAPRYNFNDYISHFNQIVTDKEKAKVVEVLNSIEPRIKDVTVIGHNVMVDTGLDKLIPINLMGDGTRKLFTIVTALYNAKNGILIIDEVDNGLYYKSMKFLWKSILKMSQEYDIQVFLYTHSVDSLNALNTLLEDEMPECQSNVKIFTLRKNRHDELKSYDYQFEKFNYLLDREEEIR